MSPGRTGRKGERGRDFISTDMAEDTDHREEELRFLRLDRRWSCSSSVGILVNSNRAGPLEGPWGEVPAGTSNNETVSPEVGGEVGVVGVKPKMVLNSCSSERLDGG